MGWITSFCDDAKMSHKEISYNDDKRPSRHFHLHIESAIEQAVFYVVRSIKPTADCAAIDFEFLSLKSRGRGSPKDLLSSLAGKEEDLYSYRSS